MNAAAVISNAIARIVAAVCALEDSDVGLAHAILQDLEVDLLGALDDSEIAA